MRYREMERRKNRAMMVEIVQWEKNKNCGWIQDLTQIGGPSQKEKNAKEEERNHLYYRKIKLRMPLKIMYVSKNSLRNSMNIFLKNRNIIIMIHMILKEDLRRNQRRLLTV